MLEANATTVVVWSLAALAVTVLVIVAARHLPALAAGRPTAPDSGRQSVGSVLAVVVPAGVFGVVGALMAAGSTRAWDLSLLHLAARHQGQTAVDVATGITTLGALPVVLALLVVALAALLWRRRLRQAAFVLAASLFAMACGGIGKVAFDRPRPEVFWSGHDWSFLTGSGASWSFPSGHTTAVTGLAAALVVAFWSTRGRRPALVGALLVCAGVGVSRVYLGAHFPTDVIAGWALAIAAVSAVRLAFGDPAAEARGGSRRDRAAATGALVGPGARRGQARP